METVRIVLLGKSGVGKTSLMGQFEMGCFFEKFDMDYMEEQFRKQITVDDLPVVVELYDFFDLNSYLDNHPPQFLDAVGEADVFMLVYSTVDSYHGSLDSLADIWEHVARLRDWPDLDAPGLPPADVILCGNKVDLYDDRMITTAEGEQWGQQRFRATRFRFFETSAKTRVGVDEAVFEGVRLCRARRPPNPAALKRIKAVAKAKKKAAAKAEKQQRIEDLTPRPIPETPIPPYPSERDGGTGKDDDTSMSTQLRRLFERSNSGLAPSATAADVLFEVVRDDGSVASTLYGHKIVILPRCPSLLKSFAASSPTPEERGMTIVTVPESSCSSGALHYLLSYVYSGRLPHSDDEDGSLWGSWANFRTDFEQAARHFELQSLAFMLRDQTESQKPSAVVSSLSVLFGGELLSDVDFVFRKESVGDSPAANSRNQRVDSCTANDIVHAHQAVLCARSPYFDSLFGSDLFAATLSSASGTVRPSIPLDLDDCCRDAFHLCLEFIYAENAAALEAELLRRSCYDDTASENNEDNASHVVVHLWRLARRWEIERLAVVCERVIARGLSIDTVCLFADECFPSDSSPGREQLLDSCIFFASYRFDAIARTSAFKRLPQELQRILEASRKSGVWEEPEAKAAAKFRNKFRVWKATLL